MRSNNGIKAAGGRDIIPLLIGGFHAGNIPAGFIVAPFVADGGVCPGKAGEKIIRFGVQKDGVDAAAAPLHACALQASRLARLLPKITVISNKFAIFTL